MSFSYERFNDTLSERKEKDWRDAQNKANVTHKRGIGHRDGSRYSERTRKPEIIVNPLVNLQDTMIFQPRGRREAIELDSNISKKCSTEISTERSGRNDDRNPRDVITDFRRVLLGSNPQDFKEEENVSLESGMISENQAILMEEEKSEDTNARTAALSLLQDSYDDGEDLNVETRSHDHRPLDSQERKRCKNAGMATSFGDFKKEFEWKYSSKLSPLRVEELTGELSHTELKATDDEPMSVSSLMSKHMEKLKSVSRKDIRPSHNQHTLSSSPDDTDLHSFPPETEKKKLLEREHFLKNKLKHFLGISSNEEVNPTVFEKMPDYMVAKFLKYVTSLQSLESSKAESNLEKLLPRRIIESERHKTTDEKFSHAQKSSSDMLPKLRKDKSEVADTGEGKQKSINKHRSVFSDAIVNEKSGRRIKRRSSPLDIFAVDDECVKQDQYGLKNKHSRSNRGGYDDKPVCERFSHQEDSTEYVRGKLHETPKETADKKNLKEKTLASTQEMHNERRYSGSRSNSQDRREIRFVPRHIHSSTAVLGDKNDYHEENKKDRYRTECSEGNNDRALSGRKNDIHYRESREVYLTKAERDMSHDDRVGDHGRECSKEIRLESHSRERYKLSYSERRQHSGDRYSSDEIRSEDEYRKIKLGQREKRRYSGDKRYGKNDFGLAQDEYSHIGDYMFDHDQGDYESYRVPAREQDHIRGHSKEISLRSHPQRHPKSSHSDRRKHPERDQPVYSGDEIHSEDEYREGKHKQREKRRYSGDESAGENNFGLTHDEYSDIGDYVFDHEQSVYGSYRVPAREQDHNRSNSKERSSRSHLHKRLKPRHSDSRKYSKRDSYSGDEFHSEDKYRKRKDRHREIRRYPGDRSGEENDIGLTHDEYSRMRDFIFEHERNHSHESYSWKKSENDRRSLYTSQEHYHEHGIHQIMPFSYQTGTYSSVPGYPMPPNQMLPTTYFPYQDYRTYDGMATNYNATPFYGPACSYIPPPDRQATTTPISNQLVSAADAGNHLLNTASQTKSYRPLENVGNQLQNNTGQTKSHRPLETVENPLLKNTGQTKYHRPLKAVAVGHSILQQIKDVIDSGKGAEMKMDSKFGVLNLSVEILSHVSSAFTVEELMFSSLEVIVKDSPDIVLLMVGENNVDSVTFSSDQLISVITEMVSKLTNLFKVKCVVLCELLSKKNPMWISREDFKTRRHEVNEKLCEKFWSDRYVLFWKHQSVWQKVAHEGNKADQNKIIYFFYESIHLALYNASLKCNTNNYTEKLSNCSKLEPTKTQTLSKELAVSMKPDCTRKEETTETATSIVSKKSSHITNLPSSGGFTTDSKFTKTIRSSTEKKVFKMKEYKVTILGHQMAVDLEKGLKNGLEFGMQDNFGFDQLKAEIIGQERCPKTLKAIVNGEWGGIFDSRPDIVLLMIGENNIDDNTYSFDEFIAEYRKLTSLLTSELHVGYIIVYEILANQFPKVISSDEFEKRREQINNWFSVEYSSSPRTIFWRHKSLSKPFIQDFQNFSSLCKLYKNVCDALGSFVKLVSEQPFTTDDDSSVKTSVRMKCPIKDDVVCMPAEEEDQFKILLFGHGFVDFIRSMANHTPEYGINQNFGLKNIKIEIVAPKICPNTLRDLISSPTKNLFTSLPDIVILMLGENDIDSTFFDVEMFLQNVRALISMLQKSFSVSLILFCEILPRSYPTHIRQDQFMSRRSVINDLLEKEFKNNKLVMYWPHSLLCRSRKKIKQFDNLENLSKLFESVKACIERVMERIREIITECHQYDRRPHHSSSSTDLSVPSDTTFKIYNLWKQRYPNFVQSVEKSQNEIPKGQIIKVVKVPVLDGVVLKKQDRPHVFRASIIGHDVVQCLQDAINDKNSNFRQNFGVEGCTVEIFESPSTVRELSSSSLQKYIWNDPDVVLIMLGECDLDSTVFTLDGFRANIRQVISKLQSSCPSVRIMLWEVLPKYAMKEVSEKTYSTRQMAVNQCLKEEIADDNSVVYFKCKDIQKDVLFLLPLKEKVSGLYKNVRRALYSARDLNLLVKTVDTSEKV